MLIWDFLESGQESTKPLYLSEIASENCHSKKMKNQVRNKQACTLTFVTTIVRFEQRSGKLI